MGDGYADEVVQKSGLSVLKSLARLEDRESLRTWLLRIVANEAKLRLRRENRLTPLNASIAIDPQFADRFDGLGHWQGPVARWQADSPEALLSSEQMQLVIRVSPRTILSREPSNAEVDVELTRLKPPVTTRHKPLHKPITLIQKVIAFS